MFAEEGAAGTPDEIEPLRDCIDTVDEEIVRLSVARTCTLQAKVSEQLTRCQSSGTLALRRSRPRPD